MLDSPTRRIELCPVFPPRILSGAPRLRHTRKDRQSTNRTKANKNPFQGRSSFHKRLTLAVLGNDIIGAQSRVVKIQDRFFPALPIGATDENQLRFQKLPGAAVDALSHRCTDITGLNGCTSVVCQSGAQERDGS